MVEVRRARRGERRSRPRVAAQVAPAAEGLSEMPPSAPLDIPPGAGPPQSGDGAT